MEPKKLRKHYMQIVPHLNKAMEHVKSQLADLPPSEFQLETNVKPYPSVKRKMELDRVKYPQDLSDLVRGRLFYSDQFRRADVLNILHQLFDAQIKNVDDNKERAPEHGLAYHGVTHVDLDINGTQFELQIMPAEFQPYQEFLHQIYEKFRNAKTLDKLSDKQREFLRKIYNGTSKKLDDHAKKVRSKPVLE
jgi:hypothetical protein